ncbi:TRAP transporter substrate-binding protein [Diaphorobacter sp. HDW4A]|uniref:TRAP transporter substrate-binding protein DctP n=1 Tax=Diaphorobacter sp. HDW4A TaxID=2714924 RepID=UPI001408C75C|nr:TRAP transporter substrate-binding protein DctP [Diaphorobacter sp. HDW4A]QIL79625.1 TRAP transporter substrate-binding protein [Diaphorobacter sp. HDW4A]
MRLAPLRGLAERLAAAVTRPTPTRAADCMRTATACSLFGMALASAAHAQTTANVQHLSVSDYRAYLPESHSVRKALHQFAAHVASTSGGKLQVDVLPGTVPGSPAQQIAALRLGKADAPQIMLVAATGLADLQRNFELFDQPYAVRDVSQVEAIVEGAQGRALLDSLSEHGLVGLAFMENGFRQLSTTKAILRDASDLRGMTVRTLPTKTSTDTFTAWGAVPVAIPASAVRGAIEGGQVEAQEGFVSQLLQTQLFEVQKHLWLTGHSYGAQVLVVQQSTWQSLGAAQRSWLKEAAEKAARVQRMRAREEDAQALKAVEHAGMQVHRIPPDLTSSLIATRLNP